MLLLVFVAAALAGLSNARGINCKGSGFCNGAMPKLDDVLDELNKFPVHPERWYQNGEHIVCMRNHGDPRDPSDISPDGICVFLQGTGGMPGYTIEPLLKHLREHNCRQCEACLSSTRTTTRKRTTASSPSTTFPTQRTAMASARMWAGALGTGGPGGPLVGGVPGPLLVHFTGA